MRTQLLRMITTVRAVRQDTRTWVHHLTGEGPTTVGRQREAAWQVLAAIPPASSTRRASGSEGLGRPEASAPVAIPGRRPVFTTR